VSESTLCVAASVPQPTSLPQVVFPAHGLSSFLCVLSTCSVLPSVLTRTSAVSDEQYECISMMRSLCWRESSELCTCSARRGGDLLGAASSAATSPTLSLTAPRGRSSTPPPISTTTPSRITTVRATTRRSTASRTRRRRSYRR
jgi:hypothetical protein